MPGTLLRDDWQKAVEDQLRSTAQSVQQAVRQPLQVIADTPRPQMPDPGQVMQSLQQTAQDAFGGLQQIGPSAQDVTSQLQQTAQQAFSGLIPINQPPPQPVQQPQPIAMPQAPTTAISEPGREAPQGNLQDYARQAAQRAGLDAELFVRQIQQESGFNPRAKSPAGATGVAQIVPQYHPGVDPNDPYASLDYAANLMRSHLTNYQGDYARALAAYNAGPGAVARYGGVPPFEETQRYVKTIMGAAGEAVRPFVEGAKQVVSRVVSLPTNEEPGTASDALNAKWKTSFDHGATYTGSYRTGTPHRGIDLVPQRGGIGTSVEAFQPGTVTNISRDNGAGGLMVYVQDRDGLTHAYMHLQGTAPNLKVGDTIARGQHIAFMGESGTEGSPHLHYEVRKNAASGDPLDKLIDPRPYMRGASSDQQAASVQQPWSVTRLGDQTSPQARVVNVEQPQREQLQVLGDQPESIFGEAGRRPAQAVVGEALEQGRRTVEDIGRQIGPNLGFDDEELRRRRRALENNPAFQAPERPVPQAPNIGPGEIAGALVGSAGVGPLGGTQADIRARINRDIEEHPAFQDWPVPVAAGVGIEAMKMVLDPTTYMTWGPLLGAGRAIGGAITSRTGSELLGKLSASAVTNGLQNALYEVQKPNPDPYQVGLQFATGAIGGPAVELGAPALVKAGRLIMDNADRLVPDSVGRFIRDESGALDVDRLTGARASEPSRRMYHGTASEFERPDASKFDPNGLFGPGYYLTSDSRVAGGLGTGLEGEGYAITRAVPDDVQYDLMAMRRNIAEQEADIRRIDAPESRRLYGDERADQDIASARTEIEHIQAQMDAVGGETIGRSGPNVRAVDVPSNLNLIDADSPIPQEQYRAILAVWDPKDARDFDLSMRMQGRGYGEGQRPLDGQSFWDTLIEKYKREYQTENPHTYMQSDLRSAGIDGVTYGGGGRVPMTDAAGREIEHRAMAIFPESLPKIRNAISGRQGGQAQLPFSVNLAGGVAGAYAGNVATPEDAPIEERLRNIGIGGLTGLAGTSAITRGGGPRLQRALAGNAPERPTGFRAPGGPELRAVVDESAGAPSGPQPRRLGEVHSNRYLLNEPAEGQAPMSEEELGTHYDMLEQRMDEARARADAIDEMLRNPHAKVYRPSWAAGYTNDALVELARRNGTSAYKEAWDQEIGFDPGSGELKYDVGESGLKGTGTRESTPAELRAELKALRTEQQDLMAAADQLGSAGPGTRFAPRQTAADPGRDLPFDGGPVIAEGGVENSGPSGNLAEEIVTRNGTAKKPSGLKGLWQEPGQVVAQKKGVIGRGVADAEVAGTGEPDVETKRLMPNLDALLGDEMPEVRAQIQKAVEDNPELFEAYQQGRISHDSLKDDLARKVGMSTNDWLKTPVGKGFSVPELVALQAAAVDAQTGATDMAREIINRGGVGELSPEEVAFGISNLLDTTRLLAVARGGRATAGRGLNALKIRMDRQLARDIATSNETKAARREADAARRGAVRAARLLEKTREIEVERKQAVGKAREAGVPKDIWEQIDQAYADLDRYNALSLHEKADDFNKLAKERAERAAARKARVKDAPEELLSALNAELAAERKIFAGRKDTWETMAFWDSKSAEIAAEKRSAFRGGLYLEQQRKAARLAEKANEERASKAWDAEMRVRTHRSEKAARILEAIGGEKPSRDLLQAFAEAVASDDPMVAAKFLKGLDRPRSGFAQIVEIARNANIMRLAGMLSSTATHLINAGGNVVQAGLEVGTRAAVVPIDIARAAITGGERQAYAAELLPMLQAYGPGFLAAWKDAARSLQTGIGPSELADLSTLRPGFRTGIPGRAGEAVDTTIEMPLRVLKASDLLFRGGAMAMHSQRVAVRRATQEGFRGAQRVGRANDIVANLEDYPELYREAAEQAARMVFQERRTVPGLSAVQAKGTAADLGSVAVSQVVPFKTTPANIFAQGFGLSPAGLLGVGEAALTRGGIAAGELPPERLGRQTLLTQERAARAAIGTGILGMGYMLGSQKDDQGRPLGMLTAMYDENEASTYPQGWRAWSLRTQNSANGEVVYVPLQNFGAAGVPLAMSALLTDGERRGKKVWEGDELMRATTGLGRYALDNTFLQGVSDWVDMLHDPARSGGKFVEGLVGSYGPYSGMGRQVQRAFSVASRNPREGWLGLLDALEANYPGLSGNVPEATTSLGDPRTAGATGLGALVGRYDIERDEPTLQVLRAADVRVPAEPKSVTMGRGYGIELTEAERDVLKRARGVAIRDAVQRAIAQPWYARADLATRNSELSKLVSAAASNANQVWLRDLGRDEQRRRMKIMREVEPSYLGTPGAPVGELEAVR